MHGPCASCRGARSAPCSTDCMLAVVHGSVRFSYLLSAETFPLCFDGGEGKHKSLLSRSLPPSPSRRSFSRSPFLQQRCKNEPRSSCTWSPFAFDACASAPAAAVPMHGVRGDGESAISANTLQKKFPAALTWWPRAGSWKLLTWISASPCESAFFLLGAQRTLGNVVRIPDLALHTRLNLCWMRISNLSMILIKIIQIRFFLSMATHILI